MNYIGVHNYDPTLPPVEYRILGSYKGISSRLPISPMPQFLFEQGFFTGNNFDDLEYIRRFCQQTKNLNYFNTNSVQDFWNLQFLEQISDGFPQKLKKFLNPSHDSPVQDDFIVWKKNDLWRIGIVTFVGSDIIRVADQGSEVNEWIGDYSCEFEVKGGNEGFFVQLEGVEVLGWIRVSEERFDGVGMLVERRNFEANSLEGMFNLDDSFELAFSRDSFCFGEYREVMSYYAWSEYYYGKVMTAASELHYMMMKATEKVLSSDEILRKFMIDEVFWPFIRKSWRDSSPFIIGRFDLALDGHKIKMLEYNSDSAGMIAESSLIQDIWAKKTGCAVGTDPGAILHTRLIQAWQKIAKNSQVHIFVDYKEEEEIYMEKYYAKVLKEAGIRFKERNIISEVKIVDGQVIDRDGERVEFIWKVWNWNTVSGDYLKEKTNQETKLSDVMLNENVTVIEPFWKIISSNKAILAVLWEMYPNHPYLLRTFFELGQNFTNSAYVSKPISGRLGENVTIFSPDQGVVEGKSGHYDSNSSVFQEFFDLPEFDSYHAIIGAWMIGEAGSGIIVREHQSLITGFYSPMITCRVVST